MKKKPILIVILGGLIALSLQFYAVTKNEDTYDFTYVKIWDSLIGGTKGDQLTSMTKTPDGGYIGAGYTYKVDGDLTGTARGDYDGLLVKYDQFGNIQWNSIFGGSLADTFYAVQPTSDGGYISCGYSQSGKSGDITDTGKGDDDALVVKFNSKGVIEWDRLIGSTGPKWGSYTSCRNITENKDGSFLAVGYQYGTANTSFSDKNNGLRDGFIMKIDKNGNVVWDQIFGGTDNDSFNAAYEMADGTFMVVGQVSSAKSGEITTPNRGKYDAFVGRFSATGQYMWGKTVGGEEDDFLESLTFTDDGSVLVAGYSASSQGEFAGKNKGGKDGVVATFTPDGELKWFETVGGSGDEYFYSIVEVKDNKYLLSGSTTSSESGDIDKVNNGKRDGLIAIIEEDGALNWVQLFGGNGDEEFKDSVDVSNGGYVTAGYSTSSKSGDVSSSTRGEDDALLVKFKTNNLPRITYEHFSEINEGDPFDPTFGLEANDLEDGDLTDEVQIKSNVDTTTAGVYTVIYKVSDYEFNVVERTQVVVVNDGGYQVGTDYIVRAYDFTRRKNQVNTTTAKVIAGTNAQVYEKATGVVDNTKLEVDIGTYQPKVGTYDISFKAAGDDLSLNTIKGYVVTGDFPVIDISKYTEIDKGTAFNPTAGLIASDTEDTTLDKSKVVINNNVDTSKPGVYKVVYRVTDSDDNVTTVNRIVVVKDETVAIGTDYVIVASDFQLRRGQVRTDSTSILSDAKVVFYNKRTAEVVNNSELTVNKGTYANPVGKYDITFRSKMEPALSKTIVADVITGNKPVLVVPKYVEIEDGVEFDPLEGVSVKDTEDTKLAVKDIVVTNPVDYNTPGVYKVDYSVVDSDFNTVTATQIVVIYDDNVSIGSKYVLIAQDFERTISDVDTSNDQILIDAQVKVYDKKNAALVSLNNVRVQKGTYTNEAGRYKIEFSLANDLTAKMQITATVINGNPPRLTIPGYTEINKNTSFDPLKGVSVTDIEDGVIDPKAVVVTGTVNTKVAGVYTLEYSVTDDDGNEVVKKRVIVVKDETVVIGKRYVIIANNFTRRVSTVDVSDNAIVTAANFRIYLKSDGELKEGKKVTVNKGNYRSVVGVYPISFKIIEESTLTSTINATVISGDAPVIKAPAFSSIKVGSTFNPLTGVTVTDTEDPLAILDLKVSGTVDPTKVGVYTLTYSVTDSDGNKTVKNRVVAVTDDTVVIGNDYVIIADDYTIRSGQVIGTNKEIIQKSHAKAYSKVTGQLMQDKIVVDNGGYSSAVKTYNAIISVNGDSKSKNSIKINVIAGDKPVISVNRYEEIQKGDSFNPKNGLKVTDSEDGTISNSKVEITNPVNTDVPGVYRIKYQVTDSDGNTVNQYKVVVVKGDNVGIGENYIIVGQDFTKSSVDVSTANADILNDANIKVYAKRTGLIAQKDVSIKKGGYTASAGQYKINFTVSADPLATIDVNATVTKGEVPKLQVPKVTIINAGDDFDPYQDVKVIDGDSAITGILTVAGMDKVNSHDAGVYKLVYTYKDNEGNVVTAERMLVVKTANSVVVDGYLIVADDILLRSDNEQITDSQLLYRMNAKVFNTATGEQLSLDQLSINRLNLQFVPGEYQVEIQLNGNSNVKKQVKVTVFGDQKASIDNIQMYEVQNNVQNTNEEIAVQEAQAIEQQQAAQEAQSKEKASRNFAITSLVMTVFGFMSRYIIRRM